MPACNDDEHAGQSSPIRLQADERGYIGRAATKFRSRDEAVVVLDVLRDQLLKACESVKRVQLEPSMSDLVPQRLDHEIRLRHIDLRDDLAEIIQLVENQILAGHDIDGPAGIRNESCSLPEDSSRGLRGQLRFQRPSEDSTCVVVHDRMQVGLRSVEHLITVVSM